MNPQAMWDMFIQTGAPEAYLLYSEARKAKELYVSDDAGPCDPNNQVQ